jgi:hypothetical protein
MPSGAKALIYGLFYGTGEPVPFQEERLFGWLHVAQVKARLERKGFLDDCD